MPWGAGVVAIGSRAAALSTCLARELSAHVSVAVGDEVGGSGGGGSGGGDGGGGCVGAGVVAIESRAATLST